MKDKKLEIKMYFFVPYNISEIQKGIQCGHAALRYARLYSAKHSEVWNFVDNHETWIILNGGTTNDQRDVDDVPLGTLNQITDQRDVDDVPLGTLNQITDQRDVDDVPLSTLNQITDQRDVDDVPLGTLNQITDQLQENDIKFSFFIEPDLNNALTSVCFLVDERVFNKKDYPDFVDYVLNMKIYHKVEEVIPAEKYVMLKTMSIKKLEEMFPEYYDKWVYFLGGIKNVFLRELLNDKDLA